MKKRTSVSIALAVALVLALAAPAFAQSMNYSTELDFDGTATHEMQAGHLCNTGAQLKQTIMGTGAMTKVMDVAMIQGKIAVSDVNDWVTSPNAVRNLTVTSVIELCAPPKMTYKTSEDDLLFGDFGDLEGVVHPSAWYGLVDGFSLPRYWETGGWTGVNNPQEYVNNDPTAIGADVELGDYERLTKQIWAVQVAADPGFSGALHQDFEAAYGLFEGYVPLDDVTAAISAAWPGQPTLSTLLSDDPDVFGRAWTWGLDDDGVVVVVQGDDYVGDYFNIEQFARTSQGTVKRFIEVSSMWSHAYLTVDSTITGMSEQTEKFHMDNIEAGSDANANWWNLF